MINQINAKQAGILLSIVLLSDKFVLLPSMIFYRTNFASIFVFAFLIVVDIFIFYLIIKIKEKYQDLKFDALISKKFGKITMKIIYSLMLIYFFFRIILILNENFVFFKDLVFDSASFLLFLVCLIPVVNSLVIMGLRSMGRTAQFFYWFIILGLFVSLMVGVFSSSFKLPTLKFNKEMLSAPLTFIFWFADYLFFLPIIDNIKLEHNYGRTIMRYLILSASILMVANLVFIGIHEVATFIYKGALSDIIQFAVVSSGIGNLDIIAVLTKMFSIYFQIAIMFYALKESLNKIIGNINIYQNIIILDFIIIFCQYAFVLTTEKVLDLVLTYFSYISYPIIFLMPVLILIMLWANKKQKGRKAYNGKIYQ